MSDIPDDSDMQGECLTWDIDYETWYGHIASHVSVHMRVGKSTENSDSCWYRISLRKVATFLQ